MNRKMHHTHKTHSCSNTNATTSTTHIQLPEHRLLATSILHGAGTFADIWEVYDQYDPTRKNYGIKVLKKSKCINKDKKCIDSDKSIKYTNAMIAELLGISLLQYTQLYEKNKCLIALITVRCIAIQLFNSLSFLHGIGGYIHADLKPENVLITLQHSINGNLMNNKYPNIKIVDLGNALSYNRNINTFEVQSLYYRAPEVLCGNEMSSSIDLWSIGCILFDLINIKQWQKK